ncbi:MAG: hypothetical protein RL721_650, partial [Candidatus Eisenbacteria bacterium]
MRPKPKLGCPMLHVERSPVRPLIAICLAGALWFGVSQSHAIEPYNGEWVAIAPAGPKPAATRDPAAIVDPVRRRIITVDVLGHTWAIPCGVAAPWTQLPVAPAPFRAGAWAAYDQEMDRMVVIAESMNVYELNLATPSSWVELQINGAKPLGRQFFAGAFDASRRRLFVYGGLYGSSSVMGDMWVINLGLAAPQWLRVDPVALGAGPGPLWAPV